MLTGTGHIDEVVDGEGAVPAGTGVVDGHLEDALLGGPVGQSKLLLRIYTGSSFPEAEYIYQVLKTVFRIYLCRN